MGLHKKLDVWKDSVALATSIYLLTKKFPSDEKFGLVSQMRRAAVSISSNIAEGAARQTHKEYIQFLYVASGSASELDTQLIISKEVKFVSSEEAEEIGRSINSILRMLQGLIKHLKNSELG